MEVAIIDWKTLDSRFVKDDLYEHINAPQWIDFSAPDQPVEDDAWFCRPDCKHPKTVDDFLNCSPPTSEKLRRSASVSEIVPLGDPNRRDATLKKRGLTQPSNPYSKGYRFLEDSENKDPTLSTPPNQKISKFMKEAVKSSTERKPRESSSLKEEPPRLKSTLSARNLFAGRDILNQITEFCNELKKLATRAKEKENAEKEKGKSPTSGKKKQESKETCSLNSRESDEREKERKPLLEVSKDKHEAMERSNLKDKQRRKKKMDEAENIPISVDLKNIKGKGQESLLQIRTLPPSPQCFTANRKATPPKPLRSKPPVRGILQELEQSKEEEVKNKEQQQQRNERSNEQASLPMVAEREAARTLDVFWFLKPCTLSN